MIAGRKRLVHPLKPPLVANWNVAPPQERITALPTGETGPLPVLGLRDQLGPQRVTLDVSQHGGEMVVAFDRERLETALSDVPRGAVMAMITASVRRQQPLHPAAKVAILMGPE